MLKKDGKELIFGSAGPAAISHQHPLVLKNVLGANIRVISGYEGQKQVNLAMQRGEVHGACGLFVSSIKAQWLPDVNAGRLKAGFGDYPILAYNLKQGGFPEARIVESYKPTMIGSVGIGVRKGDTELLAKINTSLAKLKANGTVEKILDKWGLKAQGT
jgi:hypothetical protein